MAKTDYQSIEQYHIDFPKEIQVRLQTIRDLVHEVAPEVEEVISYQIPAFRYRKGFLIYYAAFAKHVTISHPWSAALLKQFEKELKAYKVSKSVIQFPNEVPLPLGLIRKMLAFRKREQDV